MQSLLKNSLLIFGFIFAAILLVLGLNELRTVMAGSEKTFQPQSVAASAQNCAGNACSATVNFTTEKPAAALIYYGSEPTSLTLFSAEPEQTDTHAVTLSFLSPSTTYYYKIKIGDNEYDNNGAPFTFTTGPGGATTSPNYGTQFDGVECSGFEQAIEQNNLDYDVNKDGDINTIDYQLRGCTK